MHTESLQRAVEERPLLPESWRRASTLSDWQLRLTPQRAEALLDAVVALVNEWPVEPDDDQEPRTASPAASDRPAEQTDQADGRQLFTVVLHTYPRPGRLTTDADR